MIEMIPNNILKTSIKKNTTESIIPTLNQIVFGLLDILSVQVKIWFEKNSVNAVINICNPKSNLKNLFIIGQRYKKNFMNPKLFFVKLFLCGYLKQPLVVFQDSE